MEDFYSDYCLKLSIVHPEILYMRDFSEVLFYFLANSASEVHVTSVHYHVIVKKKLEKVFLEKFLPGNIFPWKLRSDPEYHTCFSLSN